jgi:hypothetical protein
MQAESRNILLSPGHPVDPRRGVCFSDEFQPNLTTHNGGSFLKSVQGDGIVLGIQEPVERGAAGAHPAGHLNLGQAFLVHGSLNLAGNHPLDRGGANFLIEAFLAKPAVEGRSDLLLFHDCAQAP